MNRKKKLTDDQILNGRGCLFLVLLTPLLFAGCYVGSGVEVSEGFRDGTVRKASETGVVWKTREVEVLGDGMKGGGDKDGVRLAPETFAFTVRAGEVWDRVRQTEGKRVRLRYRKYLTAWVPNGESRYELTGVEELK